MTAKTGSMSASMALVQFQAKHNASDTQMDALIGPNGLVASMKDEQVDLTSRKAIMFSYPVVE